MPDRHILTQVCTGMQVKTADGVTLGKVAKIWYGTDPASFTTRCDEAVCSRLEVRRGFLGRDVLFIPYNTLADISSQSVILTVDATTVHAKGWSHKPRWIPEGRWFEIPHGYEPPGTGIG